MLRLTQSDWCIRENSSRYRVAILLRFFCAAAMLYFLNVFFGSSGEVACDCQLCWIPCHNGLFNANVRCINNLIAMETFKKNNTKCAVGDALIQRRVKLNKILVEEPVDGPTWCVFAFQWLRAHLADSPPMQNEQSLPRLEHPMFRTRATDWLLHVTTSYYFHL